MQKNRFSLFRGSYSLLATGLTGRLNRASRLETSKKDKDLGRFGQKSKQLQTL